ncbi:methylated-DNA--[protein]-cysteine S-methyltransferase [Jeongeupia chitinilytica]|uniref:Transcriptional regulator n=1 Tax=Jeongeupia chitinilytica TaxID=1041641 RepID=A0ABQ3GY80_9NEIS|nr:methylated-DNA--[protein]-cysteine S-methyltransferase [Jeongeupia chitinilytica]GHD56551.1 transcriptional regulator [Jeongeupia chitinilytica]
MKPNPTAARALATQSDPRWAAVLARDREATFYYSVATTGVYCRPSCGARPKPENVAFHASCDAAEAAGFRPCKRCRPRLQPEVLRHACGESLLGTVLVAQSAGGICAVLIGDAAASLLDDLQARFPKARIGQGDETTVALLAQVLALISRPAHAIAVPLDARGTAFQQAVWQALRQIPAGETRSYAELAKALGAPSAVRAVAGACAANPLAVVVPCHRVLRSDGTISGYRWGVERKQALLALEARGAEARA